MRHKNMADCCAQVNSNQPDPSLTLHALRMGALTVPCVPLETVFGPQTGEPGNRGTGGGVSWDDRERGYKRVEADGILNLLFGESFSGLIFIATLTFVVTQKIKQLLGKYVPNGEKHGDLIAITIGVIYCLISGTSYLSARGMKFAVPWGVYVDQIFSGLIVAFIAGMERNLAKKAGLVDTKLF